MDFNLKFGQALDDLKKGKTLARKGWNGKGMWLIFMSSPQYVVHAENGDQHSFKGSPWLAVKTADDQFVPWSASQTDILAEDWGVVGWA